MNLLTLGVCLAAVFNLDEPLRVCDVGVDLGTTRCLCLPDG